jgi:hypothetical protein
MPVPDTQTSWPTVAIVTVNYNGKEYLPRCFESLQQLNYPKDKYELICVDNDSHDGSVKFVRHTFPEVHCIEAGANVGFAEGCNLGARSTQADYVAFVNNDATVDENWLVELVGALQPDERTVCAAAKILDSTGQTIDFVEGHMNFLGIARQVAWRTQVEPGYFDQRKSILAACGGAMLIERAVFLEVGGFDPDFFMFYEDVDLGWRLWVLGYRVIFVPEAVTYHRHHGSAGKLGKYQKQFLYERSALATLIKNYEQPYLDKILPVALFMAIYRTTDLLQASGIAPDMLHPHNWANISNKQLRHVVSVGKLAALMAARDIILNMPELMAKRQRIQAGRQRSDQEIFELFGQPLWLHAMIPQFGGDYARAFDHMLNAFQIREIFENVGRHILIVTNHGLPKFGFPVTPAGLRAETIGTGLEAKGHTVLYAMPEHLLDEQPVPKRFKKLAWSTTDLEDIVLNTGPDIVIVCDWQTLELLATGVYRPLVLDLATLAPDAAQTVSLSSKQKEYLANVDLYTCRTEGQREPVRMWLKRAGITISLDDIQIVPADGAAPDIELLHHFCQHPSLKAAKSTVDRTPLVSLPVKAWQILRKKGPKQLRAEIEKYFTWRMEMR